MRKLTLDDILPLEEYLKVREEMRRDVIRLKKARRVEIGPMASIVFENRETVRFQVQEMLRAERITDPEKILEEVEIYNDLVPDDGELRATLFIEIDDMEKLRATLPRLIGIEETVWLGVSGVTWRAEAEPGRSREDKTASVHYLRFLLGPEGGFRLLEAREGEVKLGIAHPNYTQEARVPPDVLASLKEEVRSWQI